MFVSFLFCPFLSLSGWKFVPFVTLLKTEAEPCERLSKLMIFYRKIQKNVFRLFILFHTFVQIVA